MSPLASKFANRVGLDNMIMINMCVMVLTFMSFGFIEVIDNRVNILALSFILRLIQGMSCGSNYITCLSIATNEYPEKKEKLIGLFSVAYGIGLMSGPVIGSTLYNFFGFKYMFFVYGGSEVILGVIIRISIPRSEIQ